MEENESGVIIWGMTTVISPYSEKVFKSRGIVVALPLLQMFIRLKQLTESVTDYKGCFVCIVKAENCRLMSTFTCT